MTEIAEVGLKASREILARFHQSPGSGGNPPRTGKSQYEGHVHIDDALAAIEAARQPDPRVSELEAEIIILADIARGYREMLERRDGASILDFRADDAVMEGLRRLAALPTFKDVPTHD